MIQYNFSLSLYIYMHNVVVVLPMEKLKFLIVSLAGLVPEAKAKGCSPSPKVFAAMTTHKLQSAVAVDGAGSLPDLWGALRLVTGSGFLAKFCSPHPPPHSDF